MKEKITVTKMNFFIYKAKLQTPDVHVIIKENCAVTYLCGVSSAGHVFGSHGLFDAVHLQLVAFAVAGCVLFGLFERRLQSLHTLRCCPQTLLQFRKLTAQVSIITYQLKNKGRQHSLHYLIYSFSSFSKLCMLF